MDRYDFNEDIPEWNEEGTISNEERILITQSMKEVNQIMESYVGIVRSNLRLVRAWNRLDILYEETERLFKRVKASREICELRNMINVGYLITRQAMERKESRGLHYTIDYPHAGTEKRIKQKINIETGAVSNLRWPLFLYYFLSLRHEIRSYQHTDIGSIFNMLNNPL